MPRDRRTELDCAVCGAYGRNNLAAELVAKPGAAMPRPYKPAAQAGAEEEQLRYRESARSRALAASGISVDALDGHPNRDHRRGSRLRPRCVPHRARTEAHDPTRASPHAEMVAATPHPWTSTSAQPASQAAARGRDVCPRWCPHWKRSAAFRFSRTTGACNCMAEDAHVPWRRGARQALLT